MKTATKLRPLLCELHAHTSWSDGSLSVAELVDLYGRRGFDVLCVTDHVMADDDPWLVEAIAAGRRGSLDAHAFAAYLTEIESEAERARARYGMLLVPGLELTVNAEDPDRAAHAVAVGLRRFVSVGAGLVEALLEARAAGAALLAAHPHADAPDAAPLRTTRRFWREAEALTPLVDRFELFNRHDFFAWVAEARLPAVACGDFHRAEHLATWKTLLPCAKDERSVVAYLGSARPAYLVRLEEEQHASSLAA